MMKMLEVLSEMDETDRLLVRFDAKKRYAYGYAEYGEYKPEADDRDFFHESYEEVLDAINYLHFIAIKLRRLRDENNDGKIRTTGNSDETRMP